MATYNWRAKNGGAFSDATNWNPSGIPVAGDVAVLAAFGGAITSTGSVGTLAFQANNWLITVSTTQISADSATIDNSSVTADGTAQLVVNGALSVGLGGSAALAATNFGTVIVNGGAATRFGTATLTVASHGIANFNGATSLGNNAAASTAIVDAALLAVGGVMQLGASAGGVGILTVQDSGQVVISAGADGSQSYFQLGAVAGSSGTAQVSGPNALLLVASNSGAIGMLGTGTLNVTGGGSARFNSSNNGLDPALAIGQFGGAVGMLGVSGAGSTLVVTGSAIVGGLGSGTLRVLGGATASSSAAVAAQAALAVAAGAGGGGSLVVDGAGSKFMTSGVAVIGGDNRGAGFAKGGVGSVAITTGGALQTGAMTIYAGSIVALDSSSQETIGGTLTNLGTLSSFGSLTINGAVTGAGTLQLGGGLTSVGALAGTNVAFASASASLRIASVVGNTAVTGLQIGDVIDLVGTTATLANATTVGTGTGSLTLSAPQAGKQYALSSDGNGGTFVTIGGDTIGVYRFFDSNYGTHFFSASTPEKNTIVATRPDLVYEGVGLASIDPASNDPNAAPVYRFFDATYGTHFFTASTAERDTVIASRRDLLYEGVGFTEHTQQQAGDVGVYRFFDTHYGTHFYTADRNERDTIAATRTDLIDEGIGFYAPNA